MILGIVVHSSITFTSLKIFPWPIKDSDNHLFYDFVVLFIHSFRMPVFFVLSGFFAALLYNKKGFKETLKSRINRIVFPFLASLILIAPLTNLLIMHYAKEISWRELFDTVKNLTIYTHLKTGHLWFLYYLILIYIICHISKLAKPAFLIFLYKQIRKMIFIDAKSDYRTILFFTTLSAFFIVPQYKGLLDTSLVFIPNFFILLTYIVYFTFGYALFFSVESLSHIFLNWKIHLFISLIVMFLYFFSFLNAQNNPSFIAVAVSSVLCSLLSWLMVFGLFGLFLNKFNHESKILTLLSKSSYWIYLMHLPLTFFLGAVLLSVSIPHFVKCLIIIILTFVILISTYKLFVERKFIGRFLNGKK